MATSYAQLHAQVLRLLKGTELASDVDTDAVTAAIIIRHGKVSVNQVPAGELWQIIRQHDISQQ